MEQTCRVGSFVPGPAVGQLIRSHGRNSTRKRDPELFGGFHVDGQFQFSWKFTREIGGAGSVQYFVNVSRCAMDACIEINSIANEPTGFYVYAISVNSGKARCRSDSGEPCLF